LDDSAGRIELQPSVCGEDLTRLILPGARVDNKHGAPTFNFLFDVDEARIQELVKSSRGVLSATKSRQEGGAGAEAARELRGRTLVLHSMSIARRAGSTERCSRQRVVLETSQSVRGVRSRADEVPAAKLAWHWRGDDSAKVSLSPGYVRGDIDRANAAGAFCSITHPHSSCAELSQVLITRLDRRYNQLSRTPRRSTVNVAGHQCRGAERGVQMLASPLMNPRGRPP
jgi:hypothetical protein